MMMVTLYCDAQAIHLICAIGLFADVWDAWGSEVCKLLDCWLHEQCFMFVHWKAEMVLHLLLNLGEVGK